MSFLMSCYDKMRRLTKKKTLMWFYRIIGWWMIKKIHSIIKLFKVIFSSDKKKRYTCIFF